MRVLMLSVSDFAGSGQKICDAVWYMTNIDIDLCVQNVSSYGHRSGIPIRGNEERIQELVDRADLLHFKGDWLIGSDSCYAGLRIPSDTPKIITVGGSGFRRKKEGVPDSASLQWHPINDYQAFNVRTALTPDLLYPEFNGVYTPHPIHISRVLPTWRASSIPLIQHCASDPKKKGTEEFVLPAIEQLKAEGYVFDFELLEKMSHAQCLRRKQTATLNIGQMTRMGIYANAELESMQFGIPTINHLSPEVIEQSGYKEKELPVINCQLSVQALVDKIREVLENAEVYSKQTIDRVRVIHSYESVGRQWEIIYKNLMK